MGGTIGLGAGSGTIDMLYNSDKDTYNRLKDLISNGNSESNGYYGINGIKILQYCYGAYQVTADTLVKGPAGTTGMIQLADEIPPEDKKIFYNNFNVVFYATPSGVGFNTTGKYTNKEAMENIKDILENTINNEIIGYISKNSNPPPFIWTDVDAKLIQDTIKVWNSTTPKLLDTIKTYCK